MKKQIQKPTPGRLLQDRLTEQLFMRRTQMNTLASKLKVAYDYAKGSVAMQEHADHHYGQKTSRLGTFVLFCRDFIQSLFNLQHKPMTDSIECSAAQGFNNYEAACDATLSRARALAEVERHALNPADFLCEVGDKPAYTGKEVLDWLGY